MNIDDRRRATEIVMRSLGDILPKHRGSFDERDDIIAKYNPDSDDLSFDFVGLVEERAGIWPDRRKWEHVVTIGDVVDLVLAEWSADAMKKR